MARVSAAPLSVYLVLGLLLPGAVVRAAEENPAEAEAAAAAATSKSVLSEDDACQAEEGSTSSTCAVSALQQRSQRGLADKALANDLAGLDLSDSLWYRMKSASYKDFRRELPPGADKDWVWPTDVAYWQLHSNEHMVDRFADVYSMATPMVVRECPRFVTYFWPMFSFWTQESLRRIEALPDNAPPEQTKKLQRFVRQASYLNCVWFHDPRKGTEWPEHVAEHMQTVRDRPSTDLEMPELPEFFSTDVPEFMMYVHDACLFWTTSMTCTLGYISRDLAGNKAGDDVCWDKVQVPDYGYSMRGHSLMPGRNGIDEEPYNHTEYLKCQEKPLTKELLDNFCPFAGHYPDGMLNISSWGHGPVKGTKQYEDVMKCEAKLELPKSTFCSNYPFHRANEGNDIALIRPFKGPITTYQNMEEGAENGVVDLAGFLSKTLAKMAALKALNKSEEELTGFQAAGVNAAEEAARTAARSATKVLVNKTFEVLPVMPEIN